MDFLTIDFETYYDTDYSLSKMSTEAYIRDPRFEVIGVGVKVNDSDSTRWYEEAEFRELSEKTDWSKIGVVAHHAQFDGAILAWHYNVNPLAWFDTLSMARAAVGGYTKSFSLATLAEYFELGVKGTEVVNAKGKHRCDFSRDEWLRYGEYCKNDADLTYMLFHLMRLGHNKMWERYVKEFPLPELRIIDSHIRMFTEPRIELDTFLLNATLADTRYLKEQALVNAAVDKKDLMSNPKFAGILRGLGVEPPMKISPATGRETFAFAKTDAGMQALAEHEDVRVQAVVAARLQNKSTLMETRLEKMVAIAARGPMPVYLNYYGAHQTGRSSGGDGMNPQNNQRGSALRKAQLAPKGYVFVVVDSSNIEARALDMLAGQEDMVEVYRRYDRGEGPDVYCAMAERVYKRPITKKENPTERQHGKVIKLGCGYGMGGPKYRETARHQKVILSSAQAQDDVDTYRHTHDRVVQLWKTCDRALEWMFKGEERPIDAAGIVHTVRDGIVLPNGLIIKYPNLRKGPDGWVYDSGRSVGINIYGGKVVENIIQALARIIVMDQSLVIAKKYPQVLTVHDEGVFCVEEALAGTVLGFAINVFRTPPNWWPGIPLNAEGGTSYSYGMAK